MPRPEVTQAGSPEEAREARVRLPQLKLDELLEEFQARLDAARGTRDRVHSRLEAVLSVGGELELGSPDGGGSTVVWRVPVPTE